MTSCRRSEKSGARVLGSRSRRAHADKRLKLLLHRRLNKLRAAYTHHWEVQEMHQMRHSVTRHPLYSTPPVSLCLCVCLCADAP